MARLSEYIRYLNVEQAGLELEKCFRFWNDFFTAYRSAYKPERIHDDDRHDGTPVI
jgi:hypothetical protein